MTVLIHPSSYKDLEAITIESDSMAAQFLPSMGTNLCSLIYKPRPLEMLVQRSGEAYRVANFADDYVADGECAGLDDMFPTIDRCFYEQYPWQGTPLPDHGEVWSIPWESSIDGDHVRFVTHGVRLPYRLEKSVTFVHSDTLHFTYRLTNLSAFDMDFLWAAHPMFVLEEGAELALPREVNRIVTALSSDGQLGGYGDEFAWPMAELTGGEMRDLRRIQPKAAGTMAKYYVKGRLSDGWCALTYPTSNLTLTLAFPSEQVPYLGILPNEGGWQDLYNIFLEPATSSFDRPDVAKLRGECSIVPAHGTYEWYWDITVSEGSDIRAARAGLGAE